jgi:hypothetical protein
MKHVIPAAVAISLVAAGLAQAQTPNNNTGATTTTNSVGPGTSATTGSSAPRNSASTTTPTNAGAGASTTMGSPNTADTNAGHGANALGSGTVGNPNINTSIRNGDTNRNGTNNAVATSPRNNPGAPHPGANSFTEGQARSRIQDRGFGQVTDLKKDEQGVWRGHATKDGKQVNVALDYQGNVVAQ